MKANKPQLAVGHAAMGKCKLATVMLAVCTRVEAGLSLLRSPEMAVFCQKVKAVAELPFAAALSSEHQLPFATAGSNLPVSYAL